MAKKIRSRIHEFLPQEVILKLDKVCENVIVSDNNIKAMRIKAILDEHEVFYNELGPGTNRLAILIDGYVFKIAMDKWGKQDNANEFAMSKELQPYVIKVYENNDLISVSEYVTLITRDEFIEKKVQFLKILSVLSESYLLGDVGYVEKNFTNWGYRDNGELVILDFAYIHNIHGEELFCPDDRTMIEYDVNFDKLRCPTCSRKFTFMDIRKKIHMDEEWAFINDAKNHSYQLTKAELLINEKSEQTNNIQKEELDMREEVKDVFNEESIEQGYKSALERLRALNNGEEVEPTVKVVEEDEELDVDDEIEPDEEEPGIDPYDAFRQANTGKTVVAPHEVDEDENEDENQNTDEDDNDGPVDFEDILESMNHAEASEPVISNRDIAKAAVILPADSEATFVNTTTIKKDEDGDIEIENSRSVSFEIEADAVPDTLLISESDAAKLEAEVVQVSTKEPSIDLDESKIEIVEEAEPAITPVTSAADLMLRAHQQNVERTAVSIKVSKPSAKQESEQEKYERLARENGYELD